MARLLAVGSAAPSFNVVDHDGNQLSLEDLEAQRFVLWFFPKADTPG